MRQLFFITFTFIFLTACSNSKNEPEELQPIANFSFSPTKPKVGELVLFKSECENTDNYEWSFEDGTNSRESSYKNPAHTYYTPGTYNVTLKAYSGKNKDIISKAIVISAN